MCKPEIYAGLAAKPQNAGGLMARPRNAGGLVGRVAAKAVDRGPRPARPRPEY